MLIVDYKTFLITKVQHDINNTEQQKKIYGMYLRVFQLFLANLGALILNLKPDFFYHV